MNQEESMKRVGSDATLDILEVVQARQNPATGDEYLKRQSVAYDEPIKTEETKSASAHSMKRVGSDGTLDLLEVVLGSVAHDEPVKKTEETKSAFENSTGTLDLMEVVQGRLEGDFESEEYAAQTAKIAGEPVPIEKKMPIKGSANEGQAEGPNGSAQPENSETEQELNGLPGAFACSPGQQKIRRPSMDVDMSSNTTCSNVETEEISHQAPDSHSCDEETANAGSSAMSWSATDLSQAFPVLDDSVTRTKAQPFDMAEAKKTKKAKERKRKDCFGMLLIGLVLLAAGITMAAVFARKSKDPNPDTVAPSMILSDSPSSAPTASLDLLLEELPAHTLESLKNITSPQWRAWRWLEDHPELQGMLEWRKKQLFALGTFFFSMDGPHWPEGIRRKWLQYTDECYWFSGKYGTLREDGYSKSDYYAELGDPCNEKGEFEVLVLAVLGLGNSTVFLPPEIALLPSLTAISLPQNEIKASVADFLPSQFFEMKNLTYFNLRANAISGPIPTELVLLTSMTRLFLKYNRFSGTIPTDLLVKLSNNKALALRDNDLTGTIPTELGLLTQCTGIYLNENRLGGPIPSEIGGMTLLKHLSIQANSLTGSIPSEVFQLTNLDRIDFHTNLLTGTLSSDFGLLRNLRKRLTLKNNRFHGTIPPELGVLVNTNGSSLSLMTLEGNDLSGHVPDEICSMGEYNSTSQAGLTFDCDDRLCGCEWCQCPV